MVPKPNSHDNGARAPECAVSSSWYRFAVQLFVLGMHRSGTSAVTRLLNMAGAYFGAEGVSTDANEENPKGFWERRDIRAVCDGLLQDAGFDWWRLSGFSVDAIPPDVRARHLDHLESIVLQLDAHRPWVVKEPRLCLLFPLFRPLVEVPVCIHVTRDPLEVAESLRRRNEFPVQVGLALWEIYTIRALEASAGVPRMLVRYDDLMSRPAEVAAEMIGQLADLGVPGLRVPTEREVGAFVTPSLQHEHESEDRRGTLLNARQLAIATALDTDGLAAVLGGDISEGALETLRVFEEEQVLRASLDEARRSLEDARRTADALEAERATRARVERELRDEQIRRRTVERTVDISLDNVERQLRKLSRARSSRLAWGASSLRRTLAGKARVRPLDNVFTEIERTRVSIEADPGTGPAAHGAARSGRPKVAVLAWDVGHNPLGRAYVLAGVLARRFDVEIWGAQFERYGTRIWAPLSRSEIAIRPFTGQSFPEHLEIMERIANEIDADAIFVSKPRLPSFGLGAMMKQSRNRPLVLDVDDHELAFFNEDTGLDARDVLRMRSDSDFSLPFGRIWTRACEPLIAAADLVTVSNVALQERFGGVLFPHARDERVFDPALYDRDETRRRLGVSASDRLVLFGGTPREHKGVVEILQALERLGDRRYRLLLFGTREFDELRPGIGTLERWAIPLPYQSFDDLPRLVGAADLSCVLQDPTHPISRYQLPAKVTDALAMGVPCLVRPTPPLQPMIDADVLQVFEDQMPLHERIAEIFEHGDEAIDRAEQGRKLFLKAYSYEALSESIAPLFDELLATPARLTPALVDLAELPRQAFGPIPERARPRMRVPGRRPRAIAEGAQYDVAMFWKQNDTGIYGRRQDMFLKYLERSDRVHSIVHFDNPTTPEGLLKTYRSANSTVDQSKLVVQHTVRRLLHQRDSERVYQHTFLHAGRMTKRLGLPVRESYADYVKATLARHGIGTRPLVCWVYPTNTDLPLIIDALDPDIVVADVVDDNRTWYTSDSPMYERVERNYQDVLARSDVVLANCAPVAESMRKFAPAVHVVANGCELPNGAAAPTRPQELAAIHGPIVGYVGNLSSRIDLDLLDALVRDHREWQFVFVGSAHLDRSILRLAGEPNAHFMGVKPYEETLRFIHHFDVALIPHLDNEMTRSMNPLKAFVYCSIGVPVVSTPVANLDELAGLITIAEGADGFAAAIEEALRSESRTVDLDVLRPHSWEVRVEQVIGLIDEAVASTPEA